MHVKYHKKSKQHWDMRKLLEKYGYLNPSSSNAMRCPFHDDVNNRSAKYYPEDNHLYCWAEDRIFSPADLLLHEGWSEEEIKDEIPVDIEVQEEFESNEEFFDELRQEYSENSSLESVLKKIGKFYL